MAKQHVRFDWAAKKMLRDKKNFDILEGFLSELLREDIKIMGLLESEGNKEEAQDKTNRVDLFAETATGEHIIVEIQNTREMDYLMRMLYGTSKAITEYLQEGQPYAVIRKVIAVSIIYFGLGKGEDYIYVGQTKFRGLHSQKELLLTKAQQELLQKPTIHQAYPEYYLIQTTRFNDIIQEPLDEWIYFLKNSKILDTFKAKGMNAAREKMAVHNLSESERKRYNRFLDDLHFEASVALTMKIEEEERLNELREKAEAEMALAREKAEAEMALAREKAEAEKALAREKGLEEGREEGREEGERKKALAIALELLKLGLGNAQIAQATGVGEAEIEELRST